MKLRLAKRFWWLRWLLTDEQIISLIKEHNQREREEAEDAWFVRRG